ncbi:MAG: hypothetical protein JXA09_16765 [Anaerolineae bacterium]|nr:hypothetical protein [Anaerolineae bacterium]
MGATDAEQRPETEAQEERGLTRRQVTILVVLVLAIVTVYALLATMGQERGVGPRGATVLIGPEPVLLSEAHVRAEEVALGWQADAELTGATTGWQGDEQGGRTLRQSAWTFRYYSPGARALQIVSVEPGGASALRQLPVDSAPAAVEADWDFTGEPMLLTFLAHGGQAFLAEHPRASVRAQLSAREGDRSIWYLTAIDPPAGASHQVKIDALSREVVTD